MCNACGQVCRRCGIVCNLFALFSCSPPG
ncbi:four-helix bundle copper-binding protein [Bacteroides thetaiotaomicron]|nr:four-helix bundle copper-binding protein [Bacteroides thetaiotaomicron]UBF14839.1 four-helix bundle copper-binding protein [Bacteroides caccae]UYU64422.1 four-helix bundle copper-binding protein [Bacteroides thetaiotaomicron]